EALASAAAGVSDRTGPNEQGITPSTLVSVALRALLDQRRIHDGDGRAVEDMGIVIPFLIDLVGDKPLSELAAGDFLRIENALPDIPHPRGVPASHSRSLFSRWTYAKENGWEGLQRISTTRIKNGWHRNLHVFLDWARKHGGGPIPDYKFRLIA